MYEYWKMNVQHGKRIFRLLNYLIAVTLWQIGTSGLSTYIRYVYEITEFLFHLFFIFYLCNNFINTIKIYVCQLSLSVVAPRMRRKNDLNHIDFHKTYYDILIPSPSHIFMYVLCENIPNPIASLALSICLSLSSSFSTFLFWIYLFTVRYVCHRLRCQIEMFFIFEFEGQATIT